MKKFVAELVKFEKFRSISAHRHYLRELREKFNFMAISELELSIKLRVS